LPSIWEVTGSIPSPKSYFYWELTHETNKSTKFPHIRAMIFWPCGPFGCTQSRGHGWPLWGHQRCLHLLGKPWGRPMAQAQQIWHLSKKSNLSEWCHMLAPLEYQPVLVQQPSPSELPWFALIFWAYSMTPTYHCRLHLCLKYPVSVCYLKLWKRNNTENTDTLLYICIGIKWSKV
jgi:hypothetical protein